jgi:hypothetical protein
MYVSPDITFFMRLEYVQYDLYESRCNFESNHLCYSLSKVLIGTGTGRLTSHGREAGRAPKAGTTQTHPIPFATKS